jgi:hypothetical protein
MGDEEHSSDKFSYGRVLTLVVVGTGLEFANKLPFSNTETNFHTENVMHIL